jgi:hypothetical protein
MQMAADLISGSSAKLNQPNLAGRLPDSTRFIMLFPPSCDIHILCRRSACNMRRNGRDTPHFFAPR